MIPSMMANFNKKMNLRLIYLKNYLFEYISFISREIKYINLILFLPLDIT